MRWDTDWSAGNSTGDIDIVAQSYTVHARLSQPSCACAVARARDCTGARWLAEPCVDRIALRDNVDIAGAVAGGPVGVPSHVILHRTAPHRTATPRHATPHGT